MSQQPIPPEADKPRVVIDYAGVQVTDSRDFVRIVLKSDVPRGMRWCLKDAGFKPSGPNTWQRHNCPDAIFQAQSLVNVFFNKGGHDA